MLKQLLFIARKDLYHTFRARETIIWVFFMPVVFFYFIGSVTGRSRIGGPVADKIAIDVAEGAGFLADQVALRLEEGGYEVVRPADAAELESYARRLTVPPAFTDSVLAGSRVALEFATTNEGRGMDYDQIRTQRAIYTVLADVIALETNDAPVTPEGLAELAAMPQSVTLSVEAAGERHRIPSGYEQAIPGIMVMFTLLIMVTSGSILLVIERKQGLLRRLAYTPIGRQAVVLGKWAGKWAVGLVQIAFAMIVGSLPPFRMDWGPDPGAVIVVMVVFAAMMAGIGMLLGSLARTEGQSIGIGIVSANLLGALGGCWWPIEIAPPWAQKLQLLLPTGWAMDAMHKLISFGAGAASVVPNIAAMAVGTAVLVVLAGRVFRFD